jgi:hypothetical protein
MNTTNTDDSSDSSVADLQLNRCPGIASDGTQCDLAPGWGSDHPQLCYYHDDQRLAVTRTTLVTGGDAPTPALVVQAGDRLHVHLDDGARYRLRVDEMADAGDVIVDGGAAGGYGGGEYGGGGVGE